MDPRQRQIRDLLDELGAVFVRRNKHTIYRLPDGETIVIAQSPSDHRGWKNCLARLLRSKARQQGVKR